MNKGPKNGGSFLIFIFIFFFSNIYIDKENTLQEEQLKDEKKTENRTCSKTDRATTSDTFYSISALFYFFLKYYFISTLRRALQQ